MLGATAKAGFIDPLSRSDNADGSILCRLRWAAKGMSASLSLLVVVFKTLLRRDASHPRPLRPIVRPLVFRQSLDRLNPDRGLAHRLGFWRILLLDLGAIAPPC